MSVPYVFGLMVTAVILALGQTPASAPASPPATETLDSDSHLEQAIRARFAKSKISMNEFQVRVSDGVAILEGGTDVVQHKGTATRLARLAGAKRVDNRIAVSERARSQASRKVRSAPRRVRVRWPGRTQSEQ